MIKTEGQSLPPGVLETLTGDGARSNVCFVSPIEAPLSLSALDLR